MASAEKGPQYHPVAAVTGQFPVCGNGTGMPIAAAGPFSKKRQQSFSRQEWFGLQFEANKHYK